MSAAWSSGGARSNDGGFSLAEMLLVLAIIALVAALAGARFNRTATGENASSIAARIANVALRARAVAIGSSRNTSVTFDTTGGMVRYPLDAIALTLPERMRMSLLVGVELIAADGQARLEFFPDGGSSGARVTIEGPADTARVEIPWLTGIPTTDGGQ